MGPSSSAILGKRRTAQSTALPSITKPSCTCFFIYSARFQRLDSISELCRLFKLEHLGCFAHFQLQFSDESVAVLRRKLGLRFAFDLQRHSYVVAFGNGHQAHVYRLNDALRRYVVRFVVGLLESAPALRFTHGALHALGDDIGVENCTAMQIASRSTDSLNQ